jgi:signal transduction histidine kinase
MNTTWLLFSQACGKNQTLAYTLSRQGASLYSNLRSMTRVTFKVWLATLGWRTGLCYDQLMLNRIIENGVLATFRLFIGVRLVLNVLGVILQLVRLGFHSNNILGLMVFNIFDPGLLFLFLSLPFLQRRLKGLYLPLGIIWATTGPIVAQHLSFVVVEGLLSEAAVRLIAYQLIPVLFIPLVIVSWQYSMRVVLLFSILTGGMGFIPILLLPSNVFSAPLVGIFFFQITTFLLVGNMIVSIMKVQRAQQDQLTRANQRIAQYASTLEALTISRERNRLARELHDVLAHTLSGVAVELEGLRAVLHSDPEKSQALLEHSLVAVREGLTETRRALQELRAKPLEDLGLGLAIRGLAESAAVRAGLALDISIAEPFSDIPELVQQSLYRVAQEALENVKEHAQARSVSVHLAREDGLLRLEICDDGMGFDPNTADETFQYGLRGMRERAEMAGGTLVLNSQTGEGTRVIYTVSASAHAELNNEWDS